MSSFQKNQIALAVKQVTMTSLELVDFINSLRKEGDVELRHDNFMAKVPKVLGDNAPTFLGTQNYGNNNTRSIYILPKREACLMAMSYSYELQAVVYDRMTELEQQRVIPQNYAQAMRLAADLYEQNERIALERDEAIRTKAQISDRKTATALNTASQATKKAKKLQAELGRCTSNATIIAVNNLTGKKYEWLPLRKWCKAQGVKAVEVVDARYGLVKAWPSAAWSAVFGVDLDVLFNGEAA
jgi:uncharacterized small protein (DUF1192 family)